MKLEQQVVNLELAKRLKELGVKQESLHEWKRNHHTHAYMVDQQGPWESADTEALIAAFTVAELGEMLPESFAVPRKSWERDADAFLWGIYIEKPKPTIISAATEADARAKMLIYLLENKLMPIPDHDCHASPEDGCEGCERREV